MSLCGGGGARSEVPCGDTFRATTSREPARSCAKHTKRYGAPGRETPQRSLARLHLRIASVGNIIDSECVPEPDAALHTSACAHDASEIEVDFRTSQTRFCCTTYNARLQRVRVCKYIVNTHLERTLLRPGYYGCAICDCAVCVYSCIELSETEMHEICVYLCGSFVVRGACARLAACVYADLI